MSGLYIHIPWCVKKCPYCDFNSHEIRSEVNEEAYVDKLLADLETEHAFAGLELTTVFFGGGTPSLFHPDSFARILSDPLLRDVVEVTMEANPGTLEHREFTEYRQAGITRVSIGVQSFENRHLERLGRIHDSDEARTAIEKALAAGFDDVNIDLMFRLPGQNVNQAMRDLETAIRLNPTHISWYELTIETNTVFGKRPPTLPTHNLSAEISASGIELLEENGFARYEVSAYGRDGSCCLHNINYWRFGDYLGIGAGAHGKVSHASGVVRSTMVKSPKSYIDNVPVRRVCVNREDLPVEFMLNALRLVDGVENDRYVKATGDTACAIEPIVTKWRRKGMFVDDRIQLNDRGYRFLDEIVSDFLPASSKRSAGFADD